MADFSQLLQKSENILQDVEGTSEVPKVKPSTQQVLEGINELYTKFSQTGAQDIQANLLLGSKGIDLPKLNQQLESICTKRLFEPLQPVSVKDELQQPAAARDLDLSIILESEIRNKILSVFDSGYNKMLAFTYTSWELQRSKREQEKRRILNALSTRSGAIIETGKQSNITDLPSFLFGHLGLAETIYFQKIIFYIKTLSNLSQEPNLFSNFSGIANDFKDTRITDIWEIMGYMVQLPAFPESEDPIEIRNSKPVIEALVKQGKCYLEDRYKIFMNSVIGNDFTYAGKGGMLEGYQLVHTFVGTIQMEYFGLQDVVIEDRPLWPMVYYCLRSGDLPQAIYCLKKSNLEEFQDLISLLEAKLLNAELTKLEDTIRFSYRRVIRNDTDPFKRIVWSVLGFCDITDEHSEVARTADDYLWLKLSLVKTDADKDKCVNYKTLQKVVLEDYGETHYDATNQPHLYFQMLALTGQFEAAFEFLSRTEQFKVHGFHMALALNELHMLGLPKDSDSPLLSIDSMDEKPSYRLNLVRFVRLFVKKFEPNFLNEIIHYFYFLRNFTDSEGENVFKTCVSCLVEETKQYEMILGRAQSNGARTKGLIDKFNVANVTAENIAQLIAENLLKKGLFLDAIELFDIANNQHELLKIICNILSRTVHLVNKPNSLRSKIQTIANHFGQRFSKESYKTASTLVKSFLALKDLLIFFDNYHCKNYKEALRSLDYIGLVPIHSDDVEDKVRTFKNLHQDICKVIPDILLATMNMLYEQYQKIEATQYLTKVRGEKALTQKTHLREQAKCLTRFTGMLPYKMPGGINNRLVQMEILMN